MRLLGINTYRLKLLPGLFFLIAMIAELNCLAQQTNVSGRVIDADTGDPIPFVNIVFVGTTVGITTDFDGFYRVKTDLPVDSLSASYIGYVKKVKAIVRGETQYINFQLDQDLVKLQEVVFIAEENPAYAVMRNVVRNKDRNDKRNLSAYEYDSYTKTEFDANNLTEKLREKKVFQKIAVVMDSLDQVAGEDGKPVLPLLITESISKFYVKHNPKIQKEYVINTKVSGVGIEDGSLTSQFIGATFQQYNFYINWVNLVDKEFISPIADGWKTYYEYSLEDSLKIGDHFCYKLDFWPKSEQDLAFIGTMWITKNEYALKQIDLSVNKGTNLNYIEKIKIQQELVPTEQGPWMSAKTRVVIDLAELTKNTPSLVAKFYNSNKNFVLNNPYPTKFYETMIEVDENARIQPKGYWEEHRHDSLTLTEQNIYQMIDTLKSIPVVRTMTDLTKTLATGYLKVGKVDLGPYLSSFASNDIEGIRIGLGMRTNIDFSDKWLFKFYGAYGFGDERFKYMTSVDYIFSRKPWARLGFETRRDIDQVWMLNDDLQYGSLFVVYGQFGNLVKPFLHNENTVRFETQLVHGLQQKVSFKQQDFDPLFGFSYQKDPGNPMSEIGSAFSTSEVILETRFAKDELFVQNDNERMSLGTIRWPSVTVKYTHGFKDVFGGDFDYDKINISITQKLRLGFFGISRYNISGGYIFDQLPYPLLKVHLGNESPFYTSFTYNLMNYFEFVSDHYVSFQYRHFFQGFVLNRIPLIKKLKWRLVGNANVLYGSLRDENLNVALPEFDENMNPVPSFKVIGNTPYIELGYGIENLFKVGRIDFFHRVTHLDEGTKKFGVKVSFQFIL